MNSRSFHTEKHLSSFGLTGSLTLLLTYLTTTHWLPMVSAQSPDDTTPLDVVTYSQIHQLRDMMTFTNHDLAALGVTQAQAEHLLTRLREWYETHQAPLTEARQEKIRTQQALRNVVRLIQVGPRDPAHLDRVLELQLNIQAAHQRHESLLDQAMAHLSTSLTKDQQQIWTTARNNQAAKVPTRYRDVPGLSATQIEQLKSAVEKGFGKTQVANILQASQQQAAQAIEQQRQRSLPGVNEAQAKVLPIPMKMIALTRSTQNGEEK